MNNNRLTFGFCGAPVAWFSQMYLSDIITSHSCYPHADPLNQPLWHNTNLWLALLSVGTLLIAIAATLISYKGLTDTKSEHAHILDTGKGRKKFIAVSAVYFSSIFTLAIIFTSLGTILVMPCGK